MKGDKEKYNTQEPGNAHQNADNSLNEFKIPIIELFGELFVSKPSPENKRFR